MTKQRLLINEKVEVRSLEEGFLGSWHSGSVIFFEKGIRLVRYDHLLSDTNDNVVESITVSTVLDGFDSLLVLDSCYRGLIRPFSPLIDFDMWGVKFGQCVDVFYHDAWWEGVVFDCCDGVGKRSVFFPDIGDELVVDVGSMRVSQDWDECSGIWNVRDKWLFFEVIDEFEKEGWPVVVSVKQIWYDVRVKKGFSENVKEWTCLRKGAWRELVEEVLADNLMLTVKELCRELEFSGAKKGLESCFKVLEVNGFELRDLIKSKSKPFDELVVESAVKSKVGDHEVQCVSPLRVVTVDSGIQDELCKDSTGGKYGESCNSSGNVLKKSKRNIWFSADIAPECCDDAIEVYLNCQLSANRLQIPHEVTVNLRKHLLFLGWKVEYLQKEGFRRWRYTQPDGNEKCFFSLMKLCEQIFSDRAKVSRFPVDEQNRLPDDAVDTLVLTPLTEKFEESKNELVKSSPDMLEVEYCPQAVMNYYSLDIKETVRPKDHGKLKDMQVKAKKHLSAVGWKLYTAYRTDRKEIRYGSPWGKVYFSLRSACKGYLDENRNVWNLAYAQLAGDDRCSAIETEEFYGKPEKKRKSSARHLASFSRSPKSRKKGRNSMQVHARDNLNNSTSNHVVVSRKSAREVVLPSSDHKNPCTVLSMLVEKHIVSVKDEVQYRRDGMILAEGEVTVDGIWCKCCQKIFSVSNYEIHAIGTCSQPSANLFLCKDKKSLQQCLIDYLINKEVTGKQEHEDNEEEDDVCSVCHSYGMLILCDNCPSAFHLSCLGLKEHPDGAIWFCPSCCCRICGGGENNGQIEVSTDDSVISCDQCERRYHISCLRMKDIVPDSYRKGSCFCNEKCEEISFELQKLLGKPFQVGADGLTWTLLKYVNAEESDHHPSDIANLAENYSKLNVAVSVMHECFEPLEEPRTRSDLVEDVIFNRWSKLNRLNFRDFYTVLLEKNDELISAATVRIYGEKVAELPLVATRFLYRRKGMCRILLNELEKVLRELGVEKLVLPAVPTLLETWTSSFGFSVMAQSDRLELLDYTFLNFPGTTMCQKLL
ncbi:Increased DNA methylation 1 [Heracleum sosnowskyi]|uniref:Increased DNA methylation 1 n=1 Tax=Heracleum sosnowskyi TaxID=360622 RepID=A0AAD8MA15_9APIA|nr:Increased DNA methylation 1 [Heracleum sosnowskyi]